MLRVALQGLRRGTCALQLQRNLGLSAVLAQKAAAANLDPIQQLFVDKIRDYKKQSSGGKSPGMSAESEKQLTEQLDKVSRMYNPKAEDFTKLPAFTFTEPTLAAVGVDVQPEVMVEAVAEEGAAEEEEKYYFDP